MKSKKPFFLINFLSLKGCICKSLNDLLFDIIMFNYIFILPADPELFNSKFSIYPGCLILQVLFLVYCMVYCIFSIDIKFQKCLEVTEISSHKCEI